MALKDFNQEFVLSRKHPAELLIQCKTGFYASVDVQNEDETTEGCYVIMAVLYPTSPPPKSTTFSAQKELKDASRTAIGTAPCGTFPFAMLVAAHNTEALRVFVSAVCDDGSAITADTQN